jgi:hypothetical protein
MTELKNYLKPLTDKNAQLVTKTICNKGFSGNLSILPRSNFGVVGQESSPQSLTAYSLNRYRQLKMKGVNGITLADHQFVEVKSELKKMSNKI